MADCFTVGRVAHITEGRKAGAGRASCQYRNRCSRGCPFGAYFSSVSSTLPAAESTRNLTLKANSIVAEVLYDKDKKKATGVRVIDAITKEETIYNSKIIFFMRLCCCLRYNINAVKIRSFSKWYGKF